MGRVYYLRYQTIYSKKAVSRLRLRSKLDDEDAPHQPCIPSDHQAENRLEESTQNPYVGTYSMQLGIQGTKGQGKSSDLGLALLAQPPE